MARLISRGPGLVGTMVSSGRLTVRRRGARSGFTLVEILMATLISLIMLGAVVAVFASVMQSINQARAVLETSDRLRSVAELLRSDLKGLTVIPIPPRDPANNEGYFEYTEGPLGQNGRIRPNLSSTDPLLAVNLDDLDTVGNPLPDSTVGDTDDILMFTVRSTGEPFVGRILVNGQPTTVESDVAEVAWFVRGNRLYRQIRLVAPKAMALCDVNNNGVLDPGEWVPPGDRGTANFRRYYDLAVHFDVQRNGWVFSTLGDLTKPENRFAHRVGDPRQIASFPFHPHRVPGWQALGLPTLAEAASMTGVWIAGGILPPVTFNPLAAPLDRLDFWVNPYPVQELDSQTGLLNNLGQIYREVEDLVLTNVIAFDVKIWDPDAPVTVTQTGQTVLPGDVGYQPVTSSFRGAYVDLAYAPNINRRVSPFSGYPLPKTRLGTLAVYDTWSNHYEKNGLDEDSALGPDTGTDGFDNDNDGLVDEFDDEWEAPPPYPGPCRGIQVTIRVFEPDSRQIRQVTITQDFLPK